MDLKFKNYLILAEDFLIDGYYDKAEDLLLKSLNFTAEKDLDERISVYFELADIYLKKEAYEDAKNYFEKILALKEMPGAYYGLAITNDFEGGDTNYSIENYKRAIDLDHTYDRAHYYLAHAYDKLGESKLAIEEFKKVIDLDEFDFVAYNDLGSIYEVLNENELAENYVKKSLYIKEDYGRALYNMGVLCKKKGDNKQALKYYYDAISKFEDPFLFLNMSAIYIEEKDYEAAIDILNRGLIDFPKSVNLHYNKACSFHLLGRDDLAKEEIITAIEINPDAYDWALRDDDLSEIVKELK
ncbi:MAG: tetratricopeptide repeat protein [Peptoniphilus harei]|uniref:tetratricopeptide repeat protein n=1 Tax=Peptoniphilus harei TaxID=54005 RepID=UPI00254C6041|nr:tetratricopeptide repeat protein [Peptoniphilus harei]MDK7755255.1 tetratricopeptide repeat protein [Peptoniphilus harei]MDK7761489.1 tetratricopeptide repeat protein [Peptoniphilus harei]MDK8271015.1 tetratricopeptide repeat protein [Peptoniphilus harei]MDK8339397.1 tetratricopeptide repeat protein [Peptoniphilus harei]MDU7532197.1 tetratricopeptide repeat protein [Peptoniphilus harei]